MQILRRARGVLGTSVLWATVWTAAAFPVFAILLRDLPTAWLESAALVASRWGLAGAGTGATFALLVLGFERRGAIARFPLGRAAIWGTLAGAGYATATIARFLMQIGRPGAQVITSIVIGALLGGCSAAAHLALAQRAARRSLETTRLGITSPTI